jgi:hypothetical protein
MFNRRISIACLVGLTLARASGAEPQAAVTVDCARPGPADLVRKFSVGQTGYSRPEQWAVAKGRIRPIAARQVRIIGGIMHTTFGGTPLSEPILTLLKAEGAVPYVSLGPFGGPEQDPANLVTPAPLETWRRLVREAAVQSRRYGGTWFEVWNEPNSDNFWRGSKEELRLLQNPSTDGTPHSGRGVPPRKERGGTPRLPCSARGSARASAV